MRQQTAHLNEHAAKRLLPKLTALVVTLAAINLVFVLALPVMAYFMATQQIKPFGITQSGRVIELKPVPEGRIPK